MIMNSARQIGLIAAGSQPWNPDICAANGDRFAYCATLSIYIYEMDRRVNDFCLHSIMAEHKKTITTISWSPHNENLIASASVENKIIIWNVADQKSVAQLDVTTGTPRSLGWGLPDKNSVMFMCSHGPLHVWTFTCGQSIVANKDVQSFSAEVCQFRCHPKDPGKIAIGHVNGSISFLCPGQRIMKHAVRVVTEDDGELVDGCQITCLEWDPLGVDYLLCVVAYECIVLVDSSSTKIVTKFQLPSVAISVRSLSWISSAPGMFITGDANSGILRLWNVSKATAVESFRINQTGFHSTYVVTAEVSRDVSSKTLNANGDQVCQTDRLWSTGALHSDAVVSSKGLVLPVAKVLCLFADGAVGLYDLRRKRWAFLREKGHVETIFDCKFRPDDTNFLATASFDGTIKVWDVQSLKAVYTSAGNEGIIYSLSWSPTEPHLIAASTARNGAFIWDMKKGKITSRFQEHKQGSNIYTVAWNQKDSKRIATAGSDCQCVVFTLDGRVIARYRHAMAVYGCDWSPHNAEIIATGCEDKNVRVFYLATNSENPVKVYAGHTAKVFHVRWSPLREGILVSGSDDCTIRMWDYTQDSCIRLFQGHTAPVRGIVWNPEIPYLLISGSWDCSIRVWDTRDGSSLDRISDHGADVYGLSCHPKRPFVLASCSRDSTVRLWSLLSFVHPLEISILAGQPWDEVLISPEHAMHIGTPPLLTGKISRDIKLDLDRSSGDTFRKSLVLFSKFFGKPEGCTNLWDLVNINLGLEDSVLSSESYRSGIVHSKHVVGFKLSEAQDLELIRMSKFGRAGLGNQTREDQLRTAADLNIKLGNVQKYCEIQAELGEWDKALAVAPFVSLKYWNNLIRRRANALMEDDSNDVIPFAVAGRQTSLLIDFLSTRGLHNDAYLVAAGAGDRDGESGSDGDDDDDDCSERVHEMYVAPPKSSKSRKDKTNRRGLMERTTHDLADWYFLSGSPVLAACCHLSINDHLGALSKLIRGFELELAVAVGQVLQITDDLLLVAVEMLSRRCEQLGRWELGVSLLKRFPGTGRLLVRLCSRCAAPMTEINKLHALAGLPSLEESTSMAEQLCSDQDRRLECVEFYMISSTPEVGLQLGIDEVKGRMALAGWKVDDVFDLLQTISAMQTEKLQKQSKRMSELLVLCAYVGALMAIRHRFDSVVLPLFTHAFFVMKRDGPDVPLSHSLISREMTIWEATRHLGINETAFSSEVQIQDYDELLHKVGRCREAFVGRVIVAASNLPGHSDVNVSCLNNQRIKGPVFFLEDGLSAMSLSDAVMWARVNPFSPLASGMRINPF